MRCSDEEFSYYQTHGNFPSFKWKIKNKVKKMFSKCFNGVFTRGDVT